MQDRLRGQLERAKSKYSDYEEAAKRYEIEISLQHIKEAQALWIDNASYSESRRSLERLMKGPTQTCIDCCPGERCNRFAYCISRLAGYGARKKGRCYDMISQKDKSPTLIVLPAGAGHTDPFVMSKYEISVNDFNAFCLSTKECTPRKGNTRLPITNITIQQAERYIAWLNKVTEQQYRLPNALEWTYAANAKGKRIKRYNCIDRQEGKPMKAAELKDVDAESTNSWGLANYLGNAQEWVKEKDGTLYAMGGSYKDDYELCTSNLMRKHDGKEDDLTGFRVVRELE